MLANALLFTTFRIYEINQKPTNICLTKTTSERHQVFLASTLSSFTCLDTEHELQLGQSSGNLSQYFFSCLTSVYFTFLRTYLKYFTIKSSFKVQKSCICIYTHTFTKQYIDIYLYKYEIYLTRYLQLVKILCVNLLAICSL